MMTQGVTVRVGLLLGLVAMLAALPSAQAQSIAFDGVTYGQPKIVPHEFNGDLSKIPLAPLRAGAPPSKPYRRLLSGPSSTKFLNAPAAPEPSAPAAFASPLAPMPSPIRNFAGMSFNDACTGGACGGGWPPDPNGDVGPNHYIEAVNLGVAIYSKTGTLLASFTEDQLWSGTGTLCDGSSEGDPVVGYDWLADRFVLSWFAFSVDAFGNPIGPFYQCIAASKTSDPVAGGWWLYPVRMDPGSPGTPPVGDLADYVKLGLWHDCLYLSANEFTSSTLSYDGVAFASLSRADMYSGGALTYALGWLPPASNAFTLMPANNQGAGAHAVQPGTPEYFVSESATAFAFEVRKFVAGPNCGAGGTMSAAVNVSQASYTFEQGPFVPQPNTTNKLDMIDDRIMQKAQYRKIGNAESLWVTHPVGYSSGFFGQPKITMQWAQIDVSGGTIAATPVQQQIYKPDTTLYRFMGSLSVDVQGNMALGYTTSNGSAPNFPSIAYSGRLATDPLGTLPQTEVQLIAGSGSQTNNCGGAPCHRWGDYSAMALDPADGCTFWYVNEYYGSQTNGTNGNWQTRIGSFKFPSCSLLIATTTTLQSSLNPSNAGDSVKFTAMVTGSGPTGGVDFTDNGSLITSCGGVPLTGGGNSPTAPCTTNALTAGAHNIVASYGGDVVNAGSMSSPLVQQVNTVGGGGTALASSLNPAKIGQLVAFTATVTGNSPTGKVAFTIGTLTIKGCGAVVLTGAGNSRTAQCSISFFRTGTYKIVARYGGDGANPPSSSAPLSEVITN